MEVHPPEHGIHTWRDFFVHMGTICLGLLIAIGLEQTVEWAHHQSERRELQAALYRDLEETSRDTETTDESIKALITWSEETTKACRIAVFKRSTCALTPRPGVLFLAPFTDPSFRAARASGRLVLLPEDEVRDLSALDGRVDIEERFFEIQEQSSRRLQAFYRRFGTPESQNAGWQQASQEDLAHFIEALDIWDGDLRNMSFISYEAHNEADEMLKSGPHHE